VQCRAAFALSATFIKKAGICQPFLLYTKGTWSLSEGGLVNSKQKAKEFILEGGARAVEIVRLVEEKDSMGFFNGLTVGLLLFLFLTGCQAKPAVLKPALEKEGEIHLYIQTLPQEADNLKFTLQEITAVKEDGIDHPLSLSFSEFKYGKIKRQRRLASGRLPSGRYSGLSFKVKEAFLKGEEGEAALLVSDKAVRIEFPFHIRKKKSSLISLELNYKKSMRARFGFSPAFSIYIPSRPITGLVGYAVNYGSNNITVFNRKTLQVVGVIATGRGPKGIALNQAMKRAYVALSGDDAIEVIDISSGNIIDRLRLSTGDNPQEPVLTPDRRLILTANAGSDTVSIIDTASLVELDRIRVGKAPHSLLIDSTGRRAFVFNTLSNTISVINIPTRSIAAVLSTDSGPTRGQFNRSGDRLFVIHEQTSYLTVIDPVSLVLLQRIFIGRGMSSIKFDTTTDLLYIGKKFSTTVDVYSPFSLLPVDSVPTVADVAYMTIDGNENYLHLVVPERRSLMVVNLISKRTVSEIDIGESPCWVSIIGER
jgi:YVTN family beta-propeller protein